MAALAAERFLAANGVLREVHQNKAKTQTNAKKPKKKVKLFELPVMCFFFFFFPPTRECKSKSSYQRLDEHMFPRAHLLLYVYSCCHEELLLSVTAGLRDRTQVSNDNNNNSNNDADTRYNNRQ